MTEIVAAVYDRQLCSSILSALIERRPAHNPEQGQAKGQNFADQRDGKEQGRNNPDQHPSRPIARGMQFLSLFASSSPETPDSQVRCP